MTDQYTKLADALAKVASNYTSSMYREDSEHIREAARILRAAGAADVVGLMALHDAASIAQADAREKVVRAGWSADRYDAARDSRRALKSALRVALAPKAGFVMVPVEPSPEMLNELFRGYTTREQAYRAMIAASQAGAAQEPPK